MRYLLRRACHIFGRSWGNFCCVSPQTILSKYFLYLWAHLHNFKKKKNNNFFLLKKIKSFQLNPLNNICNRKCISIFCIISNLAAYFTFQITPLLPCFI